MLPLPAAEVFLGLILLGLAVLPLGAVVLRLGERIFRRTVRLTVPERLLFSLYAGGATFFVLASIPLPIYGLPLILTVLLGGGVAYVLLAVQERELGLREAWRFAASPPAVLLGVLTLGVLAVEVQGVAPLPLANMLDGSLHALFVHVLLSHQTLAWTFDPYAPVGITYPQGAPVWMSLPVLLFGWPIVSAPLDVPPLFLTLSVVAAFCLGDRLAAAGARIPSPWMGALFAAFFGLVVTWPRLAIGGSFDFALGLPLFLVILGLLGPFTRSAHRSWTDVAILGIVVGLEISLSLMLGLCTLLLAAGYLIVYQPSTGAALGRWAPRWLAMVGIAGAFLIRSLVGIGVWFSYPGHVLLPVGSPPPAPALYLHALSYSYANGEINPFVWLKPKISPFPALSLEIQILLAAGLILAAWAVARPSSRIGTYLPKQLVTPILIGTTVLLAETFGLLLADQASLTASGVPAFTNIEEASAVLFLFYEAIALFPLIVAASYLFDRARHAPDGGEKVDRAPRPTVRRSRSASSTAKVVLVALVVVIPLGSGLAATAVVVPGYITFHDKTLANVSTLDIEALEWAGSNLASCSRVLVAPGSIGQYLPEYAAVAVVYPAYPTPANLSYYLLVEDLDGGVYTNSTHSYLLQLGITEVFVSAQNSVSFLPFQLAPLESSPDFSVLTAMGDVTILEFKPGASTAGCPG